MAAAAVVVLGSSAETRQTPAVTTQVAVVEVVVSADFAVDSRRAHSVVAESAAGYRGAQFAESESAVGPVRYQRDHQ